MKEGCIRRAGKQNGSPGAWSALRIPFGRGWAKWTLLDSNQRPPPCEDGALTN